MLKDEVKGAILEHAYTIVQCTDTLNAYLKYSQLTAKEYEELMELAKKELGVSTEDEKTEARLLNIEHKLTEVTGRIEKLEAGHTEVPTAPTGNTAEDPIEAYPGMEYVLNKFYYDSADGGIYQCIYGGENGDGHFVSPELPHTLAPVCFKYIKDKEVNH